MFTLCFLLASCGSPTEVTGGSIPVSEIPAYVEDPVMRSATVAQLLGDPVAPGNGQTTAQATPGAGVGDRSPTGACQRGKWPSGLRTRPDLLRVIAPPSPESPEAPAPAELTLDAVSPASVFVWTSSLGLHVRAVSREPATIAIQLAGDGAAPRLRLLESDGAAADRAVTGDPLNPAVVVWTANTEPSVVAGFDFWACELSEITITATLDGQPLPPGAVFTGRTSTAKTNPLTIRRG